MKPTELFDMVEADEELEGVGVDGDKVWVESKSKQLTTLVHMDAIEDIEWSALRDVLLGVREPVALEHMSRVTGYYSMIHNWGKGKIGELKDRHIGQYGIGGDSRPSDLAGAKKVLDKVLG